MKVLEQQSRKVICRFYDFVRTFVVYSVTHSGTFLITMTHICDVYD